LYTCYLLYVPHADTSQRQSHTSPILQNPPPPPSHRTEYARRANPNTHITNFATVNNTFSTRSHSPTDPITHTDNRPPRGPHTLFSGKTATHSAHTSRSNTGFVRTPLGPRQRVLGLERFPCSIEHTPENNQRTTREHPQRTPPENTPENTQRKTHQRRRREHTQNNSD